MDFVALKSFGSNKDKIFAPGFRLDCGKFVEDVQDVDRRQRHRQDEVEDGVGDELADERRLGFHDRVDETLHQTRVKGIFDEGEEIDRGRQCGGGG